MPVSSMRNVGNGDLMIYGSDGGTQRALRVQSGEFVLSPRHPGPGDAGVNIAAMRDMGNGVLVLYGTDGGVQQAYAVQSGEYVLAARWAPPPPPPPPEPPAPTPTPQPPGWAWPFDPRSWRQGGDLSDPGGEYGPRNGRLHRGMDFGYRNARSGADIRAASGGRVWLSERGHRSFGNWVVLEHPGGVFTVYCHMIAAPRVGRGQDVGLRQVIGNVGNTGESYGAHLHFETHLRSPQFSFANPHPTAQNPRDFMRGRV